MRSLQSFILKNKPFFFTGWQGPRNWLLPATTDNINMSIFLFEIFSLQTINRLITINRKERSQPEVANWDEPKKPPIIPLNSYSSMIPESAISFEVVVLMSKCS